MFEHEIQYYCGRGAALVEGRTTVSLADIIASSLLPEQVRVFLRAETRGLLMDERRALDASRFDYERADVRAMAARMEELLLPTAVFTREEFSELLERAVKLTFNYLCRPQLTLRSFTFRGADAVAIDDALHRISYFYDYPYFRSVLRPWLERKHADGLDHISAEMFSRTLAKIDEQVMEGMTVQDLHGMLQPMFRWIADAQPTATDRIATDAFVIFFDDKQINRVSEHLSDIASRSPQLSTQQVCILIEELIQSADSPPEPAGGTPPIVVEEDATVLHADDYDGIHVNDGIYTPTSGDADDSHSGGPTRNESESMIEIDMLDVDVPMQEPASQPSGLFLLRSTEPTDSDIAFLDGDSDDDDEEDTSEAPASSANEPMVGFEVTTEATPEPLPPPASELTAPPSIAPSAPPTPVPEAPRPSTLGTVMNTARYSDRNSEFKIVGSRATIAPALTDLRALIDDGNRKRFIKKLFRKQDPEYELALDALNGLNSWKDASAYIDSLFLRHGVDPYAKAAIQFTDVVYGRFVRAHTTDRSV